MASMTRLNHPLKRISFVLFLFCIGAMGVMICFPTPIEISTITEWRDAAASDKSDRHILRVDTACAAQEYGSTVDFARDFSIVNALSNEWSMLVWKDFPSSSFAVSPTVDLTTEQRMTIFSILSDEKKPCVESICSAKPNHALLGAINACSTPVGQLRSERYKAKWRILDNLHYSFPWWVLTFILSLFFLLCSLLYDRTLRLLVDWIWTGSSQKRATSDRKTRKRSATLGSPEPRANPEDPPIPLPTQNASKRISFTAALGALGVLFVVSISGELGKEIVKSALSRSTPAQYQVEKKLASTIADAAKQATARGPFMVDSDTRYDRSEAGPGPRLTHFFSFPKHASREIDGRRLIEHFKPKTAKQICDNKNVTLWLQYGAIFVYTYAGKDGVEIARFEVSKRDCNY